MAPRALNTTVNNYSPRNTDICFLFIPSPGGRERRKEPLIKNRVFLVTSVKGCPDANHPAYCPLTCAPAPDLGHGKAVIDFGI